MIGYLLVCLAVFVAYKTNPPETSYRQQRKDKKWMPRFLSREERFTYVSYQIFSVVTQSDGQVFLGVFGVWLPVITKEKQSTEQLSQVSVDSSIDSEREKAIQAKNNRDYQKAAKHFQSAAQMSTDETEKPQLMEEAYKSFKAANDTYQAIRTLEQVALLYERNSRLQSRAARSYEQLSQLTVQKPQEHMKWLRKAADMFMQESVIRGLTFSWQLVVYGLSHACLANQEALQILDSLKTQPRYQEVFQFRIPEIEQVKVLLKLQMRKQVDLQEQFEEFPLFAQSREGGMCQRLLNGDPEEYDKLLDDFKQPSNDLTQWKLKVVMDQSQLT